MWLILRNKLYYPINAHYTGYTQRIVRVQKLTRNLFLTLLGQDVHRQQWQLSKFLMH